MKADAEWSTRLTDAPSVARVAADAADGGVLQVSGHVKAEDREAAERELRRRIRAELKDAGIRVKT